MCSNNSAYSTPYSVHLHGHHILKVPNLQSVTIGEEQGVRGDVVVNEVVLVNIDESFT